MKKKLADQGVPYDEQKVSAEEKQEVVVKQHSKPVIGRLTEDRIRRLNDLGFVWSLRDDWTKHYDELKDFRLEHGHCNVPARYANNRRLGIWVSAQRQQYKQLQQVAATLPPGTRIPSPLTPERIDLLNQLGFTWTIRSRDSLGESWNQRFQELCEYKATHGTCLGKNLCLHHRSTEEVKLNMSLSLQQFLPDTNQTPNWESGLARRYVFFRFSARQALHIHDASIHLFISSNSAPSIGFTSRRRIPGKTCQAHRG
jgi:hypothetical protein